MIFSVLFCSVSVLTGGTCDIFFSDAYIRKYRCYTEQMQGTPGQSRLRIKLWPEKGPFCTKYEYLALFKLSPHKSYKSLRLLAWLIGRSGLLLNVESLAKLLSKALNAWSEHKQPTSNAFEVHGSHTHTGCGRHTKFTVSVDQWLHEECWLQIWTS